MDSCHPTMNRVRGATWHSDCLLPVSYKGQRRIELLTTSTPACLNCKCYGWDGIRTTRVECGVTPPTWINPPNFQEQPQERQHVQAARPASTSLITIPSINFRVQVINPTWSKKSDERLRNELKRAMNRDSCRASVRARLCNWHS